MAVGVLVECVLCGVHVVGVATNKVNARWSLVTCRQGHQELGVGI
jgi:hypothetical protein